MTDKSPNLPSWSLPVGVAVVLACVIGFNFLGAFKASSLMFLLAIAVFIVVLIATNPWTRSRLDRLLGRLKGSTPPRD